MNWAIVAIIASLLIVGGIFAVSAYTETDQPSTIASCTSCGNGCTAENNCGLASCGAVNGGTCGCGK